jgi:4-aminobutyrate aminotransferase/(S)-3-amino-2-methylpropionate transaminase
VHLTRLRSAELLGRRTAAVARGVATGLPLFAARAEGATLWDVDGREFVDFAAGIGTLNVGHRHPRVVAAIERQLEAFTHTCFQVAMYEDYVALAERLNALAPGDFAKKTLLLTTGAEATENAVKIARAATGRPAVVAFTYGYHGRTLLALSLTGKVDPYKQRFGPFAPDVHHAPYPDARRGWDTPRALAALEELFATRVAASQVAALIIEPVLGEGGFVPAPFAFLREVRRLCDRHGIVLIADEIQTGFGRTGTMFAVEQAGVAPDLITFAKSIAAGVPLSGVVGRAEIMDATEPGGLGGTFAGNPLACAAALATLDIFEEEAVLERACALGTQLRACLDGLAAAFPARVADVRGLGAMLAIEFVEAPEATGPSVAQRIAAAAFDENLIVLTAGPKACALRLLSPLLATPDEIARGCAALERAAARVLSAPS